MHCGISAISSIDAENMLTFLSDEIALYGYSLSVFAAIVILPFVFLVHNMMHPEPHPKRTLGMWLGALFFCVACGGVAKNYFLWSSEYRDVILFVENSTRRGKATFKLVEHGRLRFEESKQQNCTSGSRIHKKPNSFEFTCTDAK